MHRLMFGHSFADLVALILLPGLAFYFLNKKKVCVRGNVEDGHTGVAGSMTASIKAHAGGSSSSPIETDNVASSSSSTETNNGASSSLTVSTENCYEVFLSFRGPDTRHGFTDHLYHGLLRVGINAFRDDDELHHGEDIGPKLTAAIANSKILIPIFSESYGTSSWCLDELVEIMERKKNNDRIVLPIFYKVKPSDVGRQKGSFGELFHEGKGSLLERSSQDPTKLLKWKKALREISKIKGYEADGYEADLVKLIVHKVLSELKKKFELHISENLVGIDHHVEKVMESVDNKSHSTLFVGIHGMGGIGKTTLAKAIYNKLSNQIEHRSFIADIRESWKRNDVHYLQNQLIHDILNLKDEVRSEDEGTKIISSRFKHKKVLVLLDDVDKIIQVERLAGNRDWFSSGSKIIITTRNEKILKKVGVDYAYDLKEMDNDQALILFSKHAFRRDSPPREFKDLAHEAVSVTGGLPLSIEVLGSSLCGEELAFWRDTIDKFKKVPPEEVREKLRISYEVLDDQQKQIFLDIACFFIGIDRRIASYMWDACCFFPEEGIEVLRFMSLIKIGDDHKLQMHDQLRDLGREIVREENRQEPEKRSRLWDSKEVQKVLKLNKGTHEIVAINLSEGSSNGNIYTNKQFKNLRSLRFLHMAEGARLSGDFEDSIEELKWLRWPYCPANFEANNFRPTELVVLELSGGAIKDRWQGWSYFKMAEKLKFLDLSFCRSLVNTDFLSAFKNLEVLILTCCERLQQIDSSIGDMKDLLRLKLSRCWNLTELPAEIGKLKKLQQLLLDNVGVISALPDSIRSLHNLEILDISRSSIKKLPNDIGRLKKLKELHASDCQNMKGELPESIGSLENLEILDISRSSIRELPNSIGRLKKLRELKAFYCKNLKGKMPESICKLSSLQRFDVEVCMGLQSLPDHLPSSLRYLGVTCQSRILPSLSHLTRLKELRVSRCKFLKCIQVLPSELLKNSKCSHLTDVEESEFPQSLNTPFKLEFLSVCECESIEVLDISQLIHLIELFTVRCDNLRAVRGLDRLKYLERLTITFCNSWLELPQFGRLKKLDVRHCKNLVEIQGLDRLVFLEELSISLCASIERLLLPKSRSLKKLEAEFCMNLAEIHGLGRLEFLETLMIFRCASIERLDLPKFGSLKQLYVSDCEILVEIQGLNRLEFLERLSICRCASVKWLDLPKSGSLKKLYVIDCKSLIEIQGLNKSEFLETLDLTGCASIESLPILCCFDTLRKLTINCCDKLQDIRSLERFPSFQSLWIEDCKSLAKLPNLSSLHNLQKLFLSNCRELRVIPGLEESISLKYIAISGCSSIEILPDLSSCSCLISLIVQNCEQLTELQGLEKLQHLEKLDISGCTSLKTIPELPGTQLYQNYENDPSESFPESEFLDDDSDESRY